MTRACIHFGLHAHPIKVGDYQDTIELTSSLFGDEVEHTPIATNFAIVLEATKDLVGDMLVASEGGQQRNLCVDELLPLFDCYKHITSSSIRNRVNGFKYMRHSSGLESGHML